MSMRSATEHPGGSAARALPLMPEGSKAQPLLSQMAVRRMDSL